MHVSAAQCSRLIHKQAARAHGASICSVSGEARARVKPRERVHTTTPTSRAEGRIDRGMKRRFTSLWQGLGQRNETSDDGWVGLVFGDPKHGDFLLLKVASVFLVDEDEVEVVARAELFVDVAEGGRELKAAEEEADGDGLAADGAPSMISNLVMVSDSLYWLGAAPVVSRRMMESSMCLILMRTRRK